MQEQPTELSTPDPTTLPAADTQRGAVDVLILEDDPSARAALKAWLVQQKLTVREASTLAEARALIAEKVPDLALLDVHVQDGSGLDVLEELAAAAIEVVMISGQATVQAAIGALRRGASDFLPKPVDIPRLTAMVENVRRRMRSRAELNELRGQLKSLGRFGSLIGASASMQQVYHCIERVAPTNETVFIVGPTGTGKEVTAATIHSLSRRADQPFIAVNCGAIAASLIESEFFGHERGSFTGADKRRKGVFEQASGGTLFLDEITEMPVDLQVKLLRVLETRKLTRVGGTEVIDIDVRILAATNREPKDAVADGKLREDLLFRLYVFPIQLPPLAEREGDVRLLADALLEKINREYDADKRFSEAALCRLEAHPWPGNVRELANVVRRSYIMATDDEVLVEHLPLPKLAGGSSAGGTSAGSSSAGSSSTGGNAAADAGNRISVAPGTPIAEMEKQLIEATLKDFDGDKRKTAKSLGMSLKTLYTRLQVYAASQPDSGTASN